MLRALIAALALFGAVAGVGLALGRVALVDEHAPAASEGPSQRLLPHKRDPAHATRTPPSESQASGAQAAAGRVPATTVQARRYTVCGREEAPPRLFELSGPHGGLREPELWAVSCGSSVHAIAFDADDPAPGAAAANATVAPLIARRVARLLLPSPAPDHAPRPAPIVRLDAGQSASWLVATLRSDRNGSPVGGALFRVPFASGAGPFAASARVHDAAPGDLITATFDRDPGQDFALLQLGEARASQPSELWLFSGGPSPVRTQRVPIDLGATALATLGARLLASLDLDGDSIDEAVVLSPATGRLTIVAASPVAAGDAKSAPPIQIAVPGGEAVFVLDLDGDGIRELVIAGQTAYVVRAKGGDPSAAPHALDIAAIPLPALDGLRGLALLDTNADGKPEVVGYAHPELIAVHNALGGMFGVLGPPVRSRRVVLRGAGLSVLEARLVHLDGDGALDAIVLATREGADPQVELLVAQHVESPSVSPKGNSTGAAGSAEPYPLAIPTFATELRDVALRREIELR